jgi:hypothetical protein
MQLSMTSAVQIAVDPEISIGQFGAALAAEGFSLSARGGVLLIGQSAPKLEQRAPTPRARKPRRPRQAESKRRRQAVS